MAGRGLKDEELRWFPDIPEMYKSRVGVFHSNLPYSSRYLVDDVLDRRIEPPCPMYRKAAHYVVTVEKLDDQMNSISTD